MFTPQEIQEKTFEKALFGGYDMQTVDEFLEPLTEDYIVLYKENAILKSKMKVLVEKLEEYRRQEEQMRKAMAAAQKNADAMMAEAREKANRMLAEAQSQAQTRSVNTDLLLAEETERVNNAKRTAQSFIEAIEQDIRGHLELLESLKKRDLQPEEPTVDVRRQKPFDFEAQEQPMVVPKLPVEDPMPTVPVQTMPEPRQTETTEDIADEIEQSISRIMDLEEPVPAPAPAPRTSGNTMKYANLKFGGNYDPIGGK